MLDFQDLPIQREQYSSIIFKAQTLYRNSVALSTLQALGKTSDFHPCNSEVDIWEIQSDVKKKIDIIIKLLAYMAECVILDQAWQFLQVHLHKQFNCPVKWCPLWLEVDII